jgi:CDP-glycerol glycerophosphotransferase (TagB/SpsB family)
VRTLRLIAAGAHRVDHFVGRHLGSRLAVLVDVRTPMNLAVLRPVWKPLAEDPRVALSFVAEDMAGVGTALDADGRRGALLAPAAARWRRFDLAMTADAWNHTPLARCRCRINFFHGVAGKYDLDEPQKLAGSPLTHCDRVGFINRERLERYVGAGAVSADRAVLIGFPKLDDLVNGRWRPADVRAGLGLDPHLGTVLYAPTFSVANSLHAGGEPLIDALLSTGLNVVVKLHDRSMVPSERYTGGVDWPARLDRFAGNPRFALARAGDAVPFLAAADVLVTDHSTVGFEFALLDRPIVVFDAPELRQAARIAADKWALLRSMATVVSSPAELGKAVLDAFADPARLRLARRQARDLFAYPGHATDRALDVVYELLDLPQDTYEVLRRHRHA